MLNIFQILNANLNSGNSKAIGKVRDRLEHARANAVKDRVVAKSGFSGLSVNTSCDVPVVPVVPPKYTCTEDLEDTPFKSMHHRGETKARFEERIAADAALAKNPIFSVPTLAAALVIQRAYKSSIGSIGSPTPFKEVAITLQSVWRARAAKNIAAMLIKEQKKSIAQLAIKDRSTRKRKLAASSFKDCRKRARNNALARDRRAKRKRTQVQNARAAKRFRDFIDHVRNYDDRIIEDFESEVLNGGVIDDVRMDHADTYESDSDSE